jgi:tRNA-dihydrouridine synthase B
MQQYAARGRYDVPTDADRHRLLSGYYGEISSSGLPDAVGKMKQFACWFSHGVGNGGELRRNVHAARTPSEVLESVERFFEQRASVRGDDSNSIGVARNEDPGHGPSRSVGVTAALGT